MAEAQKTKKTKTKKAAPIKAAPKTIEAVVVSPYKKSGIILGAALIGLVILANILSSL
jgi:hypothetical protein